MRATPMSDVIERLLEVEQKAKGVIEEARRQASGLVDVARRDAQQALKESRDVARKQADEFLREQEGRAQVQREALLQDARGGVMSIEKVDPQRLGRAVEQVVGAVARGQGSLAQ